MDPALSHILEDVTRAHRSSFGLVDDNESHQNDLRQLVRAWVAERASPELLPYPRDLMDSVMANIRRQIETIEEATARMDAGTSFGLVVIQTELERFKFLVRSLLRARISKMDAHPLHILSVYDPSLIPGAQSQDSLKAGPDDTLLSSSEMSYAKTHAALLERHYTSSFLSSFPPKLRRLDDRAGAGGVGMVEGPDLDKAVFVRCLGVKRPGRGHSNNAARTGVVPEDEEMDDAHDDGEEYGPVEAACGFTASLREGDTEDEDTAVTRGFSGEKTVRMERGDIWIVRWRGIRGAVARGECELI